LFSSGDGVELLKDYNRLVE